MKISVKVKTNSKENRVEEVAPNQFDVRVKVPPRENRANQEIIEILAGYFHLPKSRLSIVRGMKSKQKVVEIEETG